MNAPIVTASLDEGDFEPLDITEIITEFLRGIVSTPDAVQVTAREEGTQTILRIQVDPADCGQVIGRHGWMATMMRYYLGVYGARTRKFFMTEIVGRDGRPQEPLAPMSTYDLENLQNPNQGQDNVQEQAIETLENLEGRLQDALSVIERFRRPPVRNTGGRPPARHFRDRSARPR